MAVYKYIKITNDNEQYMILHFNQEISIIQIIRVWQLEDRMPRIKCHPHSDAIETLLRFSIILIPVSWRPFSFDFRERDMHLLSASLYGSLNAVFVNEFEPRSFDIDAIAQGANAESTLLHVYNEIVFMLQQPTQIKLFAWNYFAHCSCLFCAVWILFYSRQDTLFKVAIMHNVCKLI